jgi:uncharacterized YigZ family protein
LYILSAIVFLKACLQSESRLIFRNFGIMAPDLPDKYYTIKSVSRGIHRSRGSRFIAFASPVYSVNEVKSLLDGYRKEYHDARHHCYAYIVGHDKGTWRINDDGEPSGTAGRPILGQINSNNLTNILVVVIRYFGGTLLGVSGLIDAYKKAAAEALKNSEVIECAVKDYYQLYFPYSSMNDVMKILKEEVVEQSDQVFELSCMIKIGFRSSLKEHILSKLSNINGLRLEYIVTR